MTNFQTNQPILNLQQQLGNQAVQHLLHSGHIQTKLTIGQPNDKYEQEADRVSDQVMSMPEPELSLQTEAKDEEEEILQTMSLSDRNTPLVQRRVNEPEKDKKDNNYQRLKGVRARN